MSSLSIFHALLGVVALLLSVGILLRRKGDRTHRLLGWVFVLGMGLALGTALALGRKHGFRVFHAYAAGSLLALFGAVAVSRRRASIPTWRFWHAGLMCFTVLAGLVAVGGVLTGLVVGVGTGPSYYRAFNLVIGAISFLGLVLINRALRGMVPTGRPRSPLIWYNGLVAALTAGLMAMQARGN